MSVLKNRRRHDYPYILEYRARWNDNDQDSLMNHSTANMLFDSAVNGYLIHECNVHPPSSSQYSLAVYYNAEFFSTIAYPAVAEVGVRVTKLGNSSVAFEVCLFEDGVIEPKAVGEYTHVFVERSTGRPAKTGMTDSLREGLQRIQKQLDSSRL